MDAPPPPPQVPAALARAPRAATPGRHALYLEAFGKGGLWGLGYDYQLHPRVALGGAVSYYVLSGDHVAVLAPYLGARVLGQGRHRWFAHAGPLLMLQRTPSPAPEWAGRSEIGVSAQLSSGYEYRSRVLIRAALMGTVGKGGPLPWAGVSLGWAR